MKNLIDIISFYTGFATHAITYDMRIVEDLGIDSITMYEIIGEIEATFEIEDIPAEVVREAKTVRDVEKLLRKYTLAI